MQERRWKIVALVTVGIAIGVAMTGTPAVAHVASWTHNWNKHIKPKADSRYYKKATADARFVNAAETPWAVMEEDGTLVRGNAVASAARLSLGAYEVIFKRDVTTCAYAATLADPEFGAPNGEIAVASRGGNANGVFLQTRESAGTPADRGFHLVVHCGGAPPPPGPAPRVEPGAGPQPPPIDG